MSLQIRPLDEAMAREMVTWRYEPPYDSYNFPSDGAPISDIVKYYVDPATGAFAICEDSGKFVGFCSFGDDAKVGGGDYQAEALDIGMGIRPDMTGQKNGALYAAAAVDFAKKKFVPKTLRVSVAAFNQRAQKVWQKLGFVVTAEFKSTFDGQQYLVLVRTA